MTYAKRLAGTLAGGLMLVGCATQPLPTATTAQPVAPAAPQYGLMSVPQGVEKEVRIRLKKEAHFTEPVKLNRQYCEKQVWLKLDLDLRIEKELEASIPTWKRDAMRNQVMAQLMPQKPKLTPTQWNDMVQRELDLRIRIEIEKEVERVVDGLIKKKELEIDAELRIKQVVSEDEFFQKIVLKLKVEFEQELRKSNLFSKELEIRLDLLFKKIVKIECDNRAPA